MAKTAKKKYKEDEVKRYLGVLSEQQRHDIKAIGEQYVGIKKALDSHTETLSSHTEMIAQLMIDMTEVKNGLKTKIGIEDFARLEKRVARLESRPH